MSFLKSIAGAFLVTEEVPDNQVDVNKPLSVQDNGEPFKVVNNPLGPIMTSQPLSANQTITLTKEEQDKFASHFENLFQGLNCPMPSYHELMDNAEAFSDIMAPKDYLPRALKSFKGKLTKDIAIQTAQSTLAAIKTEQTEYNTNAKNKLDQEVGGMQNQLDAKRDQLLKLQQEIQQLETNIQQGEVEIKRKSAAYNSFSDAVQQKIQGDINNMQAYL